MIAQVAPWIDPVTGQPCLNKYGEQAACNTSLPISTIIIGTLGMIAIVLAFYLILKWSLDGFARSMGWTGGGHSHTSPAYKREFARMRPLILARDGRRCTVCGAGGIVHVHHIIPRARGGPNTYGNLTTLCPLHHGQAHGRRW